jgi:peptide/nickel transport system permease protein
MAIEKSISGDLTEISPRKSEFRRIVRVFWGRKLAAIGAVLVLIIIIMAIFAPLLAPYDPYQVDVSNRLMQPSREHLLGTDAAGRDTLSRVIYGSQTALLVGVVAVGCAMVIGILLGTTAAYFGGWVYSVIMRFVDALMAVPSILIALTIAAVLGSGIQNVIIAIGIGTIAPKARVMCGQALSVMQNDYVTAGRSIGASNFRIMLRHIIPNAFPPLIVLATISVGSAILLEAGLSFLGIGISPPGAAWGGMVNDGYKYLLTRPILSLVPGIFIMMVVFGFNMIGDGLRDALDPRLRGVI